MSERLERLLRAIEEERQAALADLGLAFDGPLLVTGRQTPAEVVERRLQRVPAPLHSDARLQLMRRVVVLPWLQSRRIPGMVA